MASNPDVEMAVDNDVLLKASCYGLALRFWPQAGEDPGVGVLGAARFVLATAIERGGRVRDRARAAGELDQLFALAAVLEPSDDELRVAAELSDSLSAPGSPSMAARASSLRWSPAAT